MKFQVAISSAPEVYEFLKPARQLLENVYFKQLLSPKRGHFPKINTQILVARDLATRNCLIGKAYQLKISDYGTYNELYVNDYYKVDGNTPIPIRWASWEAVSAPNETEAPTNAHALSPQVYQSKYTTKSDVWAFAVTLWEILTLCRRQPFDYLTDPEVMENLARSVAAKSRKL